MRQRTAVVNSSGVYVNLPFELQDQLNAYAEATGSNKSRATQDALRFFLNNTKEVNEMAQLAIACQKKGQDLTPLISGLRASVSQTP